MTSLRSPGGALLGAGAILALSLAAHAGAPGQTLKLTLTWTEDERSRDSTSVTEVFVVDGATLTHSWDHHGYYPPNLKPHKEVKLPLKDPEAVKKALAATSLQKSQSLKLDADAGKVSIPERRVTTAKLVVEENGKTREITVVSTSPDKPSPVLDALSTLRAALTAQAPFSE